MDTIHDYITGKKIPLSGPEANRQFVEKHLVEKKGYKKEDILVSSKFSFNIQDGIYASKIDLLIKLKGKLVCAIKCAAGSLISREKEILSAARIFCEYQIPIALVTDSSRAIRIDVLTGRTTEGDMSLIPSREKALETFHMLEFIPCPEATLKKSRIMFKSYDEMNLNIMG